MCNDIDDRCARKEDLQGGRQLNVCQQCVLVMMKANLLLGRISRSTASRLRGGMMFFYLVLEATSGVLCPLWVPWYSKDGDSLKVSPAKGHQGGQGLEHMMYEEMLRELVLFSLQKKRLVGGS